MAVQGTYAFRSTSIETVSGIDGATGQSITFKAFEDAGTLNASSTYPVSKQICKVIALVAGAYTLDLTTETGLNGAVQDGTGLKVRLLKIKPLGSNPIEVSPGASNGYAPWGAGKSQVYLAGCNKMEELQNKAPTIGAGARQLDITGSDTETFEITLWMG